MSSCGQDPVHSIENAPTTTSAKSTLSKTGATNDLRTPPSRLHTATAALIKMKDTSCSTDTGPTTGPNKYMTKFTDLPLELLVMICNSLLEDFYESFPKAPPPVKLPLDREAHTYNVNHGPIKLDLRARDMSFLAAFKVNQSIRDACRIAFFRRTARSYLHKHIATRDLRISSEKKFARNIHALQEKICNDEQRIATHLADEDVTRERTETDLERVVRLMSFRNYLVHLSREREAAERVDRALRKFSLSYQLIRIDDEDGRSELLPCINDS